MEVDTADQPLLLDASSEEQLAQGHDVTYMNRPLTQQDQLQAHVTYMNRPLTQPHLRRSFEQLRTEFPAQFTELCKVHLSFIAEVPPDFLEEADSHRVLVGVRSTSSLTRWLGLCEQARTSPANDVDAAAFSGPFDDPPSGSSNISQLSVLESLLSMLSSQQPIGPVFGQSSLEGLFRKSGSVLRQRQLRDALASGRPVEAADLTPHDVAGALKGSLGELQEPLLTRRLLPYFQQLAAMPGQPALQPARQLKGLRLLVQLLPARNRCLLGRLLCLLHAVARDPATRMGPEALGTVLGPALLYPAACGWDPASAAARAVALNSATARLVQLAPALMEVPESLGIDAARTLVRLRAGRGRQLDSDAVRLSLRFAECPEPDDPDGFTRAQVAGLYAAVRGMPESGRKRRLIRRFNRCNGGLSPHRLAASRPRP